MNTTTEKLVKAPRTQRKNFRIRVDLYSRALAMAQKEGTTFTALIHEGLRMLLDQKERNMGNDTPVSSQLLATQSQSQIARDHSPGV